jgi:tRNA G26 N,N-dimethylase Trm1
MSAYATSSGGSPKDAWNAPARALRLEKTRDIGTSCGEQDREHGLTDRSAQKKQKRKASRSETQTHDPFWHGPRMNASFAAQVIAQATGKPASEGLRAHSAYCASGKIPRALLIDCSI